GVAGALGRGDPRVLRAGRQDEQRDETGAGERAAAGDGNVGPFEGSTECGDEAGNERHANLAPVGVSERRGRIGASVSRIYEGGVGLSTARSEDRALVPIT